jgi:hypothetical protein
MSFADSQFLIVIKLTGAAVPLMPMRYSELAGRVIALLSLFPT